MRRRSIFLLVTAFLASVLTLSANTEKLDSLKSLYDKGDFEQAEVLLQSELEEVVGKETAGLHYNMGNVLLKLNKVGLAIYHYECALRLSPFDEDVQYNLHLAKKRVVDEFEVIPQFSTYPFFIRVNYWLDVLWLGVVGFLLVIAGFVLVLKAKVLDKSNVPVYWKWFLLAGLFLVFWARVQSSVIAHHVVAIVTENNVEVQAEPNDRSKHLFLINEGVELFVEGEEEKWLNVKAPNGVEGWVSKEQVKIIK